MNAVPRPRLAAEQPEAALDAALAAFATAPQAEHCFAVDFELVQYWLDGAPRLPLVAVYRLRRRGGAVAAEVSAEVSVTLGDEAFEHWWAADAAAFRAGSPQRPWFDLQAAVSLQPVEIPKPWGREIWYTGIERRGVAQAQQGGHSVPLPWLLAAAPRRLAAGLAHNLILLKILDPLPDPVFGDLYFELHREKREVYVVTDIDRRAWPDGVGGIRFGFDAALRREYGDDARFLTAYLEAVAAYREVRLAIDGVLDENRTAAGIGLDDPVDAGTLRRWLSGLPETLQRREREHRAAMDRFTGLLPLRVGDVLKVPRYVPHSLQHGVRTVEFQTPVYERLILSFAQKVLTQGHWDTEEAARLLQIEPPPPEPSEPTGAGHGWREERIVAFDDFEVLRLTLDPAARCPLRVPPRYALAMAVGEGLALDAQVLAAGQALLLPPGWRGAVLENQAPEERHLLLALPRFARG
jgi:hypothetical protein